MSLTLGGFDSKVLFKWCFTPEFILGGSLIQFDAYILHMQ